MTSTCSRRATRWAALWLAGSTSLVTAGCASGPTAFSLAADRARAADAEHQYQDAAALWGVAAEQADSERDREEAQYRQGLSALKDGDTAAASAIFSRLASAKPEGNRSARAAYELSNVARVSGDTDGQITALERCVTAYPNAAIAPGAVRILVNLWETRGGHTLVEGETRRLLRAVVGSAVEQHVAYQHALSLERQEQWSAALKEWITLSERFPYPSGAYWDDALAHAAEIYVRSSQPDRGVAALEEMLSHRETSDFAGSYERARYAPARYRIAEIYRDQLNSPEQAADQFERVAQEHPTHRLADAALWQGALAARAARDADRACDLYERLIAQNPQTRYLGCGALVCSEHPVEPRECRDYIVREANNAQRGPDPQN